MSLSAKWKLGASELPQTRSAANHEWQWGYGASGPVGTGQYSPPAGAIEKTAQDTLADDINDVLNAILALRSSGAALTDDLNA